MEKKEKNIHEGHRKRLTDLAVSAGFDAMSDVQIVEFFLTYIFPRGDVNLLAHRLLDQFGDFSQIIEAGQKELCMVDGINERSAKMIKLFGELFFYFTISKMGKKQYVESPSEIVNVMEDCLRFRTCEDIVLLGISAGKYVTHRRRISRGSATNVNLSMMELTSFLTSAKPASLAIGHSHPYGSALPSQSDEESFKMVESVCEKCGIRFVDSYIVGDDGVYSHRENKFVRFYCDYDKLKKIFGEISLA